MTARGEPRGKRRASRVVHLASPSLLGVMRLVTIVCATAGLLYLLYLTRGVIKLLAISLFTAIALAPLVDFVQRTRLPRAWAIGAVYLAGVLAIFGTGALLVPSVASQVSRLAQDGQHQVRTLRASPTFRRYDDRYHVTARVQAQLKTLPNRLGAAAGPLRDVTVGAFGLISNLVAVLSIAFLLILHGRAYTDSAIALLPRAPAERWRHLAPQIYSSVSGYVLGNLAISVIAGTLAWVAMTIIGVPFAVPLAITVAFLDLIPMVGATLAAIIVALAALLVSPIAAVAWLVYMFLYQQVENYLIQPVVYKRAVKVSALVTIVAVLAGGALLGLLGVLLAIPAAATLQLVVEDLRASTTRLGLASTPSGSEPDRRIASER